jgi:hypothetical protein
VRGRRRCPGKRAVPVFPAKELPEAFRYNVTRHHEALRGSGHETGICFPGAVEHQRSAHRSRIPSEGNRSSQARIKVWSAAVRRKTARVVFVLSDATSHRGRGICPASDLLWRAISSTRREDASRHGARMRLRDCSRLRQAQHECEIVTLHRRRSEISSFKTGGRRRLHYASRHSLASRATGMTSSTTSPQWPPVVAAQLSAQTERRASQTCNCVRRLIRRLHWLLTEP